MKVTQLKVENFKRIIAVDVSLGEHITEISGANGAGKSSTIDALWVLLKGKRVAPEEPIRAGQSRCRIQGQLGEYLVTRTFTRDRHGEITTGLRIERGDEGMPATEAFMKHLIGEHMLDPGDFIALSPADKFDVFRSFVPEVDFKLIANQNRKDYDRRTDVNRVVREARAAASMINVPEGTPQALIDVDGLVAELSRAGDQNAATERRRANREKASAEIEQLRHSAVKAGNAIKEYSDERQARCEARVAELEALIRREREECARDIGARTSEIQEAAERAQARAQELAAALEVAGPLPESIDLGAIQKRISEARAVNANVLLLQQRQKHLQVAEQFERESEELTKRMEERERTKQAAIAKAQLPIAGITFKDEEVYLNGVPFEQASTALKLKCGVAIAVAKNPQLRLVWIRDASLLDDKSYETVAHLAREFDCQILLETVRPIGSDAVILEDGQVKKASEAAQQEAVA